MPIWFNPSITVDDLKDFGIELMAGQLGIAWKAIGDNYLQMSMPVTDKTRQPYGFLHGGASCVLAETVGSLASALVIDLNRYYCVGMEINANHLRSVSDGHVTATCTALHLGKNSHVWDIKMTDDNNRLICVSRHTVAILESSGKMEHLKLLQRFKN